ncbi:Cytochrome P450 2E1 [Halotydeus destructor]|nr:Cytochrome P450 2E1 [Halotydeus destructor]
MLVWLLAIVVISVVYLWKNLGGSGPYGLPVIGYVPFLTENPSLKLLTLSKTYGPVYSINIWGRTYFVLNSYQAVKEALNDNALLDRPHEFTYLGASFQNSALGNGNGLPWRSHRKFATSILMGHSAVSQSCDIFRDVAEDLIDYMRLTKGRPTNYRTALSKTATNAISCVLYSKKYDWEDKELSYISEKMHFVFHMLRGAEFSFAGPIFEFYMKTVNTQRHRTMRDASQDCAALFERMAEKRYQDGGFEQKRDYFDHFLANLVKEVEDNVPDNERLFTIKELASTTQALVLGASDTSSETMYWALYFLAKHPVVQKRVQQELDDVIGSRVVAMADRSILPYTLAFLEETQRVAAMTPITATREAISDTVVCGVKIPKGSYILPNIYACLSDETYFKEPEKFDPTRFLNDDGKFVSIEANCQFTLGKRNCVGQTFARAEMLTIIATVLQNFNISFPKDEYDVGHIYSPLRALFDYELCISERNQSR